MSRLYEALRRAEHEGGVRVRHTAALSRLVPTTGPDVGEPAPDDSDYERLKVLLAATRGEVKTTLCVSALGGEGVSTVTGRLARALAASAPRGVLVIDMDADRPTVSRALRAQAAVGLGELLTKEATRDDAIVASRAVPHVFVLGPGQAGVDLAQSTMFARFEELVGELRDTFDHVLIDGGALQRMPSSALVAGCLDSTLLVVEAERGNLSAVRAATDTLRTAGAHLLGVVLNRRRDYVPDVVARWIA